MNTPDKLKQLRHKRDEAVLAVGAIDKEIKDALKDVPPLKVGDVYVTEPFQHWTNKWIICYYIITEQDKRYLEVRSNTTDGTHARVETLSFVVEQDHNHEDQVGFHKSYPMPHLMSWEYVYPSQRWAIDTDWEHDQPKFLCNLAEDEYTKEYWGQCADEDEPTIKVMLRKELMYGMYELEMPNYFAKDEVELEVTLNVRPEIYCLRMWATHKLMNGCDGLPDWMLTNTGWAQPFRWYQYPDKTRYTLTEQGWLNSSLERCSPKDSELLELVEYDKDS